MTTNANDTTMVAELSEYAKTEAQKADAKTKKQQRSQEIYNNFATPLIGTFLNLPKEPTIIKCPACGVCDLSVVQNDLKWWANEINRLFFCLSVICCCCWCFDYRMPCKQTDLNHYCSHCSCYFGRAMVNPPLKLETNK